MNMPVFEHNCAALESRQPALADRIRRAARDDRLIPTTARDGTPILRARLTQGERGLHSVYDPRREADRRLEGTEDAATLVLFGAGAMIDAGRALSRSRHQAIVVADLGPSVWRSILETVPVGDLLSSDRLYCADDETTLTEAIHSVHHAAIRDGVALRELRSWTEEPDHLRRFSAFRRTLNDTLEAQAADLAAYRRFGRRWFFNIFHNTLGDTGEDRFSELIDRVSGRDVAILGAGPSAERLYARRGTDPIICVDTAYPSIRRAGVVPDAVVTVDAHAWSALHLRQPIDASTILVADIGVSPRHADRSLGTVLITGGHPLADLLRLSGSPIRRLPVSYTSVMEAAIQVSRAAGARSVVLHGFDAGYPRAKTYARGTYHYDLFSRSACRRNSQESQFAEFVYRRGISAEGSPPFFPLPGAEAMRRRMHDLIETDFDFSISGSYRSSRFFGCPFWIDHQKQVGRSAERVQTEAYSSTPAILAAAGPHGRAHIPVHAALSRRRTPEQLHGEAFSESLRFVGAIVAAEMSRYC